MSTHTIHECHSVSSHSEAIGIHHTDRDQSDTPDRLRSSPIGSRDLVGAHVSRPEYVANVIDNHHLFGLGHRRWQPAQTRNASHRPVV